MARRVPLALPASSPVLVRTVLARARLALPVLALLAVSATAGCAPSFDECEGPDDPACGTADDALRIAGSYVPDDAALAAGAALITYDDVSAWDDGAHCSGGLTSGARVVRDYLQDHFDGIASVGGYACRQNTANPAKMSVHGSGRALDIMIPVESGDADNGVGDPIANWLIANSTTIGIQYLIWDHTQWSGARSSGRVRAYTGPNPHIDHIHAELTIEASREETAFFGGGPTTPPPEPAPTRDSLQASFVAQSSSADADPTGAAQFVVCAGAAVTHAFELANAGSVRWVDEDDRTAGAFGRAVRLGVPGEAADPFVGASRISLNDASLPIVEVGARTRFTMHGRAPSDAGLYRSSWRLVDEGRAWFGPEVWLSYRVEPCSAEPPPSGTDADGDGVTADRDCDDESALRHPGALDACGDGLDADCDGIDPSCGIEWRELPDPLADDPGFDFAGELPVHTRSARLVGVTSCAAMPGRAGRGAEDSTAAFVALAGALALVRRARRSNVAPLRAIDRA